MSKKHLKKCPFCGGDAGLYGFYSGRYPYNTFVNVRCDVCGASSKAKKCTEIFDIEAADFFEQPSAVAAETAWNNRIGE